MTYDRRRDASGMIPASVNSARRETSPERFFPFSLLSGPVHPHGRDSALRNRPVLTRGLSSPLRYKQGNRIQALGIPPFLTHSLRSFPLVLSVSCKLVHILPFVPFCPLPFRAVPLFWSDRIGFHELVERFITVDRPTTNTALFSPVFYLVKGRRAGRRAGRQAGRQAGRRASSRRSLEKREETKKGWQARERRGKRTIARARTRQQRQKC